MLVSELLKDYLEISSQNDCEITGMAIDSRKVKPGDLFFAVPGTYDDGADYIDDAVAKGAVVVVQDKGARACPGTFQIEHLASKIGPIAAKFYGYPSRKITTIGVTGTNGKSSICYYIAGALAEFGQKCGIIGTLGVGFPGQLKNSINTTPDPITIQQQLAEFLAQGVTVVAMEVSSHALEQQRVNGVEFDVAIFTNLTRDHLDYHGSMQKYGVAKKKLFQFRSLKYAIINCDDEFGRELIAEFADKLDIIGYSLVGAQRAAPAQKYVSIYELKLTKTSIIATVDSPWGKEILRTNLLGRFNVANLLAVALSLKQLGITWSEIFPALMKIDPVPGRMQQFGGDDKPLVVVDYAHTPDALEQALIAIREYCQGKLWCLFGCGGERDRGKRPQMGKIAEQYSDYLIITNDNPRNEAPETIAADILAGIETQQATVKLNRKEAITYAVNRAQKDDIILIAGKGHEDYQQVGDDKLPFNDVTVVEDELKRLD